MFELFMYVYSCNALSARFFAVDRALNSYIMIMIMIVVFSLTSSFWTSSFQEMLLKHVICCFQLFFCI